MAASATGLLVVLGAERLRAGRLVTGDADQGLVFPALFALGVILLSTTLSKVHISEDTVLTGDLNLMALTPKHVLVADGAFKNNKFRRRIHINFIRSTNNYYI